MCHVHAWSYSLSYLVFLSPTGEPHLFSHTQIAYLSHHLPFIPLHLLHASNKPALTFPIFQILKLLYKPVSQCTNRRNASLSFSVLQSIKQSYKCLIKDRWPKLQTEDKWTTCPSWKPFRGSRHAGKKHKWSIQNTPHGSHILSSMLTNKSVGVIQNAISV